MATCIDCATEKPASNFYAHPAMAAGHTNVCKVCHRLRMKRRRLLDPAVQAADVARAKRPARKAVSRVTADMWRDKNPAGYKAQNAANNAIRDGRLKKEPCAICGGSKVRGFHRDYSKPLDVVWLCAKCHCRLLASFPEIRALPGRQDWQPTHRHRKGGSYKFTGAAKLQSSTPLSDMDAMVVYQAEDGTFWVTPHVEFLDGRFESIEVD